MPDRLQNVTAFGNIVDHYYGIIFPDEDDAKEDEPRISPECQELMRRREASEGQFYQIKNKSKVATFELQSICQKPTRLPESASGFDNLGMQCFIGDRFGIL